MLLLTSVVRIWPGKTSGRSPKHSKKTLREQLKKLEEGTELKKEDGKLEKEEGGIKTGGAENKKVQEWKVQEVADRYITLTLEMARTYRRLEGDYENKIEG